MFSTDSIPAELIADLDKFQQRWQDAAEPAVQTQLQSIADQSLIRQLSKAVVGSDFIAKHFIQTPGLLIGLLQNTELNLQQPLSRGAICSWVQKQITNTDNRQDDAALDKALRIARRDFMLRTVWRDLNRLASLQQTTRELSNFADACIAATLNFHYQKLTEKYGVPVSEGDGSEAHTVQPMLVLGMGKLGAFELNVSSDIDLIFAFPETGNTQGGTKSLGNLEFFIRLGQHLIKSLDAVTADGFVFRVDMRLRPYGQSGALVMNYDSLENYYQTQGREWERYAMIKARVVAATSDEVMQSCADVLLSDDKQFSLCTAKSSEKALYSLLQPFTYRKYLDYSAVDALRAMKQLITREVARKGLQADVKLGAGGIREVEFIVQVFQLIRGGRDQRLQERQLLNVLPLLVEDGCLPAGVDEQLATAYTFLRNTEHAIQGWQDKQTQQLPIDANNQLRLAWIMGFDSWSAFLAKLNRYREQVSQQFAAVISDPEEKSEDKDEHFN